MAPTELSPALRAHLAVTYDLLRPLGEGGMGVVWLGRDRLLDRDVAIKVLRRGSSSDEDGARRFLQEARLAARLQHPGIVPLLTFGEVGEERFYVMPFVRGETLADRIRRGPLPEAELRRIITEVADALAYVHARGIVHRDVKPANILLDAESGAAMLTDFGIARHKDATSVTGTGLVVGTPRYLAPEQASAGLDVVDGRADIYALGLVAWEAATAALPFGDVSPNELLARKLTGALDNPRTQRPELSAAFADIILRAAAMSPEQRFPRAAALADALRPLAPAAEDPLAPFDAILSHAAIIAVPVSALITAGMLSEEGSMSLGLRVLIGVGASVGVVALMATARMQALRQEFAATSSWRELLARAWRPPSWWFGWWPKRYRHFFLPDHLPPKTAAALRRQVYGISWIVGLGLAYQVPLLLLGAVNEKSQLMLSITELLRRTKPVTIAAPLVILAGLAVSVWPMSKLMRGLRRAGLDLRQVTRLFNQLYRPSALHSPALAALHEYERAQSKPQGLPALQGAILAEQARARAAGWELSDVESGVRQLADFDARWATDERALAAEVAASDASRAREQAQRLRALPAPTAQQRQMLDLLEGQLRLVSDSEAALERLRERRQRAERLANALWEQLRNLPARNANTNADSGLRAIADDLQRLLDDSASH